MNIKSPHESSLSVLVIELMEQENAKNDYIHCYLYQSSPNHLFLCCVPILIFVDALDVQVEVFVFQLK